MNRTAMRRITQTVLLGVVCALVGCDRNRGAGDASRASIHLDHCDLDWKAVVGEVEFGLTRSALRQRLGCQGLLQFACRDEGREYQGISFSFQQQFIAWLFVFEDDRLRSILPFDSLTEWRKPQRPEPPGVVYEREYFTPREKTEQILRTKSVELAEFARELESQMDAAIETQKAQEAFPFQIRLSDELREQFRRWSIHFDATRAGLGMSEEEFSARFGKPVYRRVMEDGMVKCAWGPRETISDVDNTHSIGVLNSRYWLTAEFSPNDGRAKVLYGDHMFREPGLVEPDYMLR